MDISSYRCARSKDAYLETLRNKLHLKNSKCGLCYVKDQNSFDLSSYKGDFPVAIVLNYNHVIGWTNTRDATNIFELEPHVSNPKNGYYWSRQMPSLTKTKREIISSLNYHCVQLSSPQKYVFDGLSAERFEQGRYILWLCVLKTKCISLERLIDLEVKFMCAVASPEIIEACAELYKFKRNDRDALQQWIETQYRDGFLPRNDTEAAHEEFNFDQYGSEVAEMLS